MKTKKLLTLSVLFAYSQFTFIMAQEKLPPDWQTKTRAKFDAIKAKEVTFEVFEKAEREDYLRLQAISNKTASIYSPKPSKSKCGNGDFESSATIPDPLEWTGGSGNITNGMSDGFLYGPIGNINSHHTIVTSGLDPTVSSINQVHGGARALRLGNNYSTNGISCISKTFTLSNLDPINFWYAPFLLDPGSAHTDINIAPSFEVIVKTYPSGIVIPGAVNLGNGTNKLTADMNNPFFKVKPGTNWVYKEWSCVEIKIPSTYLNQMITIEFIVKDCNYSPPFGGGHPGYVYIDDFCGNCIGSNDGWVSFNSNSTDCRTGKICFNYGLPTNGTLIGTAVISLAIYQNGSATPITTLTSPTLSSGSSYCFNFPCTSPLLNSSFGGFDFVATGTFKLGTSTTTKTVGTVPYGQYVGNNNDCQCGFPTPEGVFCCDSVINLIKNPCFEAGNSGFSSQYAFQPLTSINSVLPGQYTVSNNASNICSNWKVKDHTACTKPGNSKVLLINGETTQGSNTNNVIWEQNVSGLETNKTYQFCAYFKNFPACCFDIKPKVRVDINSGGSSGWTTINTSSSDCDWQLVSFQFNAATSNINIKIYLEETTKGDGNDLAIDDISLQKMSQVAVDFSVTNNSTIGGNCQITASVNGITAGDDILSGKNCKYVWIIGKLKSMSPLTFDGTPIYQGAPNWGLTTNFPGFTCQQGVPYLIYLFVTGCDCAAPGADYQISMNGQTLRVKPEQDNEVKAIIKKYVDEFVISNK